jgi:hypothetical protein
MAIHYLRADDRTACGTPRHDGKKVTYRPSKVTCGICKRTRDYREMMEASNG